LAPKLYGLKYNIDGKEEEIVKIKGFKNPISFNILKKLLKKNTKIELNQIKWIKHISESNIEEKDELYTLMLQESKRILIYSKNVLSDTSPLLIENKMC
jgi:hypothetical protein